MCFFFVINFVFLSKSNGFCVLILNVYFSSILINLQIIKHLLYSF